MRSVEPQDWASTLATMKADGYAYLDLLAAVDRQEELEVVAHVVHADPSIGELLAVRVAVADGHLPSLAAIYPAAVWHEREIAEMFGLVFDGHPDPRPLLRHTAAGRPPLRKDTVLGTRAVLPWPGAVDEGGRAGSRRRQVPPGVPDGWLAEDDA